MNIKEYRMAIKNVQSRETGTTRRKTNHYTLFVGNHNTQANTNNNWRSRRTDHRFNAKS